MHPINEAFIGLLAPARCVGCEEPAGSALCRACEPLVQSASTPSAVFEYGGPIADGIQRFKYHGRSDLGASLGSLMVQTARSWVGQVDAVVPVPLHWRRRRWRGYDQAALLSKPIARSIGVPVLLRGLRRTRNTPSQLDLSHRERLDNVAGAFAPCMLRGVTRVLLVDDVRTTGATLDAASSALRVGGVQQVRTLVLATRVLTQGT